jgi:hypothetical protein
VTRRTETPPAAPASSTGPPPLPEALDELRGALADTRYPLAGRAAEQATVTSRKVIGQLDDYLLPRLDRLDAPLLAVVGGSTGAGKSTLVNSLVRAPVSPAGVLRPTTRGPVLVHHPSDGHWFSQPHLVPGLARTTDLSDHPDSLRLVAATALVPGLALLDAPDIDSVVRANHALSDQLLAAADLWLFVTTAARYADAVPWSTLATARDRGTALALVLDRVPPGAEEEIGGHLAEMLGEHGLAGTRLFVLPESGLDGQGLLAERLIRPVQDWIAALAADPAVRAGVVRQTVDGAVAALLPAVADLAAAQDEQVATATALNDAVDAGRRGAASAVDRATGDGGLLGGQVLERWQEFVAAGGLAQALRAHTGRLRDGLNATVTGRTTHGRRLREALADALTGAITAAAADTEDRVRAAWRGQPDLLERVAPMDEFEAGARRLVRLWQRWVLDLVRRETANARRAPRAAASTVNATGLLVMIAVCASARFLDDDDHARRDARPPRPDDQSTHDGTGGPPGGQSAPDGWTSAPAGGEPIAGEESLRPVFGEPGLRALAERARTDLRRRVGELLDAQSERFAGVLAEAGIAADAPDRLRAAGRRLAAASAMVTGAHAARAARVPQQGSPGAARFSNGSPAQPAGPAHAAGGPPARAGSGQPAHAAGGTSAHAGGGRPAHAAGSPPAHVPSGPAANVPAAGATV